MSTALSSTDFSGHAGRRLLRETRRSVADLGPLLRFRDATVRGRSRLWCRLGCAAILLTTVLAAWLPAYLPSHQREGEVLSLLPSAMFGVLVISVISAAASGGGRELVPREEAVAFPVSPLTDHLGAVLLAPLNIAWLLQAWTLLGATAYVANATPGLVMSQLVVMLWLVTATSVAQVVGWLLELLRRGPHGRVLTGGLVSVAGLAGAWLIASGQLVPLLKASPTMQVTIASLQARKGPSWLVVEVCVVLILVTLVALAAGARAAAAVQRRPAADVLGVESSVHQPRGNPGSDLVAVLRVDRSSIWRSVPLRRGLLVLALLPGLVALAGDLEWQMLTILPGLVASGAALLFGVNAWALDGRGALWRDSLPANPTTVFLSRAIVVAEVLLVGTVATIILASLRAGLPTAAQLSAVACTSIVVVAQVVSASMRWSLLRPFAVDLRSPRATPAPPLVMVGYSVRLAVSTTLVGVFFSVLTYTSWEWPVLFGLPMLLFSSLRIVRAGARWTQPVRRATVVATVAG